MAVFIGFAVAIAAVAGIFLYFYLKRTAIFWGLPEQGKGWKRILAFVVVVIAVPAVNLFGIWALVVLHIVGFALVMDIIQAFAKRFPGEKKRWERVYRSGLFPVLATVLVIGYSYWNMKNVRVTEYTVYTEKEIRDKGYGICLISDLHFPTTMDAPSLEAYCNDISKKKPDAVVLCGDIVDERSTKAQMEKAFQILSGIQSESGIYYVYGNHDRARYSKNPPFTQEELQHAVEDTGITVLKDRAEALNNEFTIIGRDDKSVAGRKTSEELLQGVDKDDFLLLLDHQPAGLKENAAAGYDLQLSGHTHAGQMWPVGPLTTLFRMVELNYGYQKQGSFQAIVTSGIAGWGYPLRTGKHSEYVMIKIRKK